MDAGIYQGLLTEGQETQGIAKDIVLGSKDVDLPKNKDHPDEDIGNNPRGKVVGMGRNRAVPEQSRQRPGIGTRNGREMDKGRGSQMRPVSGRLAEDVDDEDDLGGPEVVAHPQHDKGEDEQVIQDEMGGYIGGCGDQDGILGEEVPQIADLGEQQQDPANPSDRRAPMHGVLFSEKTHQ